MLLSLHNFDYIYLFKYHGTNFFITNRELHLMLLSV